MDKQKILDSLSPQEIKVLPYIKERVNEICVKSNLNKVSVLRALQYLENKKIVKLSSERNQIVELGVNGALYLRKGLPERKLLSVLSNKRILPLNDAEKESSLSGDEFKAALGVLRKKNAIEMKNNKIITIKLIIGFYWIIFKKNEASYIWFSWYWKNNLKQINF